LIAFALLWLLFRGTDWSEVGASLRGVHPGWLFAAQIPLWASAFARVQRWSYVVRAVSPAPYRALLAASQIGVLVNFVIPARVGELVRAYVLSRLAAIPLARSLAMVTLDRVNDVIGLLAVLLVAALALADDAGATFPAGSFGNSEPLVLSGGLVRTAAWILAMGVLACALLLVGLYAGRDEVLARARAALGRVSTTLAERVTGLLAGFGEGLHVFRSRADLARAILWSLLSWGADLASVAAVLLAFRVDFPWYAPFVALSFVAVTILVPLTPGTVGQFHLAVVAGLLLAAPEVEPARAKAVAIVEHLSMLFPVVGLGLYCLLRERLGWSEVMGRGVASRSAEVTGAGSGG
jgi:hypothetical protein